MRGEHGLGVKLRSLDRPRRMPQRHRQPVWRLAYDFMCRTFWKRAIRVRPGSLATGDTAAFGETYGSKNAGSGKTLTAAGSVNDGNSGGN